MGFIEYSVLISIGIFLVGFAGFVLRIAQRIGSAESKAETANTRADNAAIQVAASSIRVETVARLLSEHKETAAREYVSYRSLENLENRLVDAITRLGDRIDGLFTRIPTSPKE